MSELTEGLERIYRRFELYTPHCANALQRPLSMDEIKVVSQDLPFAVSPEIYELYQWRNGSQSEGFLFQNYNFLSLNRVVYEYQAWLKQIQVDYPEMSEVFQFRLPLFELWSECGVFLTVVPDEQGGGAIYDWDMSCNSYEMRYSSLTNLILYSAEWYEAAIFDEREHQWVIDGDMESLLNLKYKP